MRRKWPASLWAVLLAACLSALGGCATTRRESLSAVAEDRSWELRVLLLVVNDTSCLVGRLGHELLNFGQVPLGGGFLVTILNAIKTRTVGELNLACQMALPGGTSQCTSAKLIVFQCETVLLSARRSPPP